MSDLSGRHDVPPVFCATHERISPLPPHHDFHWAGPLRAPQEEEEILQVSSLPPISPLLSHRRACEKRKPLVQIHPYHRDTDLVPSSSRGSYFSVGMVGLVIRPKGLARLRMGAASSSTGGKARRREVEAANSRCASDWVNLWLKSFRLIEGRKPQRQRHRLSCPLQASDRTKEILQKSTHGP